MDLEGEVFFLKMNNGDDLLCMLIGDEPECLWITQPYVIDLVQHPMTFTVTPTIMRWFPFDSLLRETVRIDKKNIITYMIVDDEISRRYLSTIDIQSREEREIKRDMQIRAQMAQMMTKIANTAIGIGSGSIH
jgi:hypothetical protein